VEQRRLPNELVVRPSPDVLVVSPTKQNLGRVLRAVDDRVAVEDVVATINELGYQAAPLT
jgi:hypothetical protein